jgi:hypothetical protein
MSKIKLNLILISLAILSTIPLPTINSGAHAQEDHGWTVELEQGYWNETSHLNFESMAYKGSGHFRETNDYFVNESFKEWTIWYLEWGNTFPIGNDNLNAVTYLMSVDNGEGSDWLAVRIEYLYGHENKMVWVVKIFWGADNRYVMAKKWNILEKYGISNVRCKHLALWVGDDGMLRRRVSIEVKKEGVWTGYGGVQYGGGKYNHSQAVDLAVKVWKKGGLLEPNHINGSIGDVGWENLQS